MTRGRTAAVLLSWNDAGQVIALLERLRTLEPPPDFVTIVDNGSDGDTLARIRRAVSGPAMAAEAIALGSNRGFAAAANCGIARALAGGADWIWLLNSDVVLPDDVLASLLAAGDAGRRCGMAGVVLTESDGAVQARGGGRVNLWTGMARHVRTGGERCDYLSGACLLLRASMLREIGLFDERYFFYWEDVELGFRARAAGWTLAVADKCSVVHFEGSSLGRWSEERWYLLFAGMRRFLREHAPIPKLAIFLRLLQHSASMLRHGRREALRGAWRAVVSPPGVNAGDPDGGPENRFRHESSAGTLPSARNAGHSARHEAS